MKQVNQFKITGVLVSTTKKTLPDGKELVEATVSQTKEWRGDKFTKLYPFSAFNDVMQTVLDLKPGTEVLVDGSIRASAWAKDPTKYFVNLTASNVTKVSDIKDAPTMPIADMVTDEQIPF